MVLSLRRDDSGVASTVATMMSLLVILLFMSIALVDILPRQQNDAEFATTETAITSFEQIRGLSQGPVFATGPDHVAIVEFDNDAHLTKENVGGAQHHLTTVSHNCFPNFEEAKTDVDTIDASGSTNYGAALQVAVNELLGYGDPTRARVIILLTDGQNTCCPNQQGGDTLAQAQARRARDNGIVIYTIGLGSTIDEPMLRYIASVTGGT